MAVQFLATDKKFKGHNIYDVAVDGVVLGKVRRLYKAEQDADWCEWGYLPENPERVSFQFSCFEQAYKSLTNYPPRA